MDLSHPLASLLPASDAGALAVLTRTEKPLTGRRVAQLARRDSHASTIRALDRLAKQGMVLVEQAGRANLYQLNRDHLLVNAILSAVASTTTLRDRISGAIGHWQVPPVHVSLYGSLARGEAGPDSDIDVLVVRRTRLDRKDAETWSRQLTELESEAWRWTGNPLSWFETTEADLTRTATASEPIFNSWREDSIDLAGEPLTAMLRRLKILDPNH